MEFIKIRTKLGITTVISVCLLFSIGSCIVSTKIMQASAQLPDHLYTPHTGIIHQTPERLTLVPLVTER
jgi:hypothetical protein